MEILVRRPPIEQRKVEHMQDRRSGLDELLHRTSCSLSLSSFGEGFQESPEGDRPGGGRRNGGEGGGGGGEDGGEGGR